MILYVSSRCDARSVHEFPQFLATGKTGRFPQSKFRIMFAQKVSGFRTRRFEALNLMPGLCCWMYEGDKRSKRFLRSWCCCHVVAPLLPLIAQRSNFMFCLCAFYFSVPLGQRFARPFCDFAPNNSRMCSLKLPEKAAGYWKVQAAILECHLAGTGFSWAQPPRSSQEHPTGMVRI